MREFLVNDRCLYRGGTGVSVYLRNILANWPGEADISPVGFCSMYMDKSGKNLTEMHSSDPRPITLRPLSAAGQPARLAVRLPNWSRRRIQKMYAWTFRRTMRRGKYSACFEPNYLAIDCGCPTVTTIHDLSVVEHPEWHPPDRVKQWEADLAESLAATSRFIAVSEFTGERMQETWGIPAEKICVIPLAARPLPFPTSDKIAGVKKSAHLPQRYLLHVGAIEPRKNISTILDAYSSLPVDVRNEVKLVLAGPIGWGRPDFWRSLIQHPIAGEALTTGYASDGQLAVLLAGADALLAPSYYEGFGLPVLEAMACGTAVICSDIPAFREVGADAAVNLPPTDTDGWRKAMLRSISDADWRLAAGRAGRARAAEFSWSLAAAKHKEAIAAVMQKS